MEHTHNITDLITIRRNLRQQATNAEKLLWKHLRNRGLNQMRFCRQYSVGNYVLDFYCPRSKLAIELDGGQHGMTDQEKYDLERTRYLNQQGIKVLRFWNNDVLQNIQGVTDCIRESLIITPPTSP